MAIARIESYDPLDMTMLSSDISDINFGGVIRGRYCSQAVVIKPILEGDITALALFLEDKNGFNHARFDYYASKDAIQGIVPGGPQMSDYFVENPGVSDFITSDYGVSLDPDDPGFVWLDVNMGLGSTIGAGTINYRFVFEYN
jgi:hypothetical protein